MSTIFFIYCTYKYQTMFHSFEEPDLKSKTKNNTTDNETKAHFSLKYSVRRTKEKSKIIKVFVQANSPS